MRRRAEAFSMTKLVIVESPTKIKSLKKYLPDGYTITSCVGHIRDLPKNKKAAPKEIRGESWADYGVDVDNDFTPHYVLLPGKKKVIDEIKKHLKNADELFLATDEDREGESISWHLVEVLKPKVPVRRMVFNEITQAAITEALENPRDVDENLVQAQETRRILDRLYGYTLSPLLWRKIGGSLSAGRVQSVAVRLIVQRERERHAFRAGSYWDLTATLAKQAESFQAKLVTVDGKRIATSRDFDKDTGQIAADKDVLLLEQERARELQSSLRDATWRVADVNASERQSKPQPPFITSTLQQEANNRLNLSARQTMQVAQRLYENGFITYMRTDSTHLSDEALAGARKAIEMEFGRDYVMSQPRTYKGKQAKGAQEAHEAIRPAGGEFVHPDQSGLSGREHKLYELIWRRTLASQMPDERFTSTTVTVEAAETTFTATGKRVEFPGYRAAYPTLGEDARDLPSLQAGDVVDLRELDAEGHETKPPARYTEATLVRALEDDGVGRPSTYADIIERIQNNYVVMRGKALVPTFTAFAVTGLLEKHFPRLVDEQFTASMEETLDEIAAGQTQAVPYLREFFHGQEGLKTQVEAKQESIDPGEARKVDLEGLPATVRVGRFGPYVEAERDGERVNASVPETVTPDELTAELVKELVEEKAKGPESIGTDPETGQQVFVLTGRFGPYLQLGENDGDEKPPRASLPKGVSKDEITIEEALFLLRLPRQLGEHPDGGNVIAGLGRYGPYVGHEREGERTEYRSLSDMDHLRRVELAEALELLSQPKARGRQRQAKVLKEVGDHPEDGKPVRILDGRYGPYVKHGSTNATVPKGTAPDDVTMAQAVDLLAERAGRSGPKRKRKRAAKKRKGKS